MKSVKLALLMVIICAAAISAEQINLEFRDANTNQEITDVSLSIVTKETILNPFITNSARFSLEKGEHKIKFIVNDQKTKGADYYGAEILKISSDIASTVYLQPVGTLQGIVKDNLDNVVKKAKLKFECSGMVSEYPKETDEFGTFFLKQIPTGECKIYASYKSGLGSKRVNVTQGSFNEVEIKLDSTLVELNRSFPWEVALIVVIICMILVWHKKMRKKENKVKNKTQETTRKGKADIIETLPEKEQEIVRIIARDEKTTQAKIYNETGIPKASLHRYITSLERKKIIHVQKVGKIKRIRFSEWFVSDSST